MEVKYYTYTNTYIHIHNKHSLSQRQYHTLNNNHYEMLRNKKVSLSNSQLLGYVLLLYIRKYILDKKNIYKIYKMTTEIYIYIFSSLPIVKFIYSLLVNFCSLYKQYMHNTTLFHLIMLGTTSTSQKFPYLKLLYYIPL